MDVLIAIAALILALWFAALGLLSEGERERREEEERRRQEAPVEPPSEELRIGEMGETPTKAETTQRR